MAQGFYLLCLTTNRRLVYYVHFITALETASIFLIFHQSALENSKS